MNSKISKIIANFVVYILLYLLLVKNFIIYDYAFCFFYLAFLINFPLVIRKEYELIVFALVGLLIDTFSDSLGIHLFGSVLVGFMRHYVMRWFPTQTSYDGITSPSIKELGLAWYMRYALILISIEVVFVILLDSFTFMNFGKSMGRIASTIVFTFIMIVATEYLFFTPKRFKRRR